MHGLTIEQLLELADTISRTQQMLREGRATIEDVLDPAHYQNTRIV